jgi:DNA-binding response OmpR family regulator
VTRVGIRECECCGTIIDDGRAVVELGELFMDRQFHAVTWKGQRVHLTRQQFEVLELMVTRAGKLVPRTAFFISILPEECEDNQLSVIVCRLRAKFAKVDPDFDRISTIRGSGFSWLLPEQERLAA